MLGSYPSLTSNPSRENSNTPREFIVESVPLRSHLEFSKVVHRVSSVA